MKNETNEANEEKQINKTKLKIQQTALNLFSKRGYSAVSIRDIGTVVGIKESTLYYHFKSKQDIFQSLLVEVQEITTQMTAMFNNRFEMSTSVKETEFVQVGLGVLVGYLLEENINKFIHMLMIEQYVNEEAAMVHQRVVFEVPLKQMEAVFHRMMDRGYFKQEKAECLAVEYYGLIYFVFQRYFSSGEATCEIRERALHVLETQIERFYQRYRGSANESF